MTAFSSGGRFEQNAAFWQEDIPRVAEKDHGTVPAQTSPALPQGRSAEPINVLVERLFLLCLWFLRFNSLGKKSAYTFRAPARLRKIVWLPDNRLGVQHFSRLMSGRRQAIAMRKSARAFAQAWAQLILGCEMVASLIRRSGF